MVVKAEGKLVTSWVADGERFFLIKKPFLEDDNDDVQDFEDEEESRRRGAARWLRERWLREQRPKGDDDQKCWKKRRRC